MITPKTDSECATDEVLEFGDMVKKKIEVRKFKKAAIATGTIDKNKFAIFGEVLDKKKKMGHAPTDENNLEVNLQQLRKLKKIKPIDDDVKEVDNYQVKLHSIDKGVIKQNQHFNSSPLKKVQRSDEGDAYQRKQDKLNDDKTIQSLERDIVRNEVINHEVNDEFINSTFVGSEKSNSQREKIDIKNEIIGNSPRDQINGLRYPQRGTAEIHDKLMKVTNSDSHILPEQREGQGDIPAKKAKEIETRYSTRSLFGIDKEKNERTDDPPYNLLDDGGVDIAQVGLVECPLTIDETTRVESGTIQQDKNFKKEKDSKKEEEEELYVNEAAKNEKVKEAIQKFKSKKSGTEFESQKARMDSVKLLQPIKLVSNNQSDLKDGEIESKVLERDDVVDDWLKLGAQTFNKTTRSNSVDIQRRALKTSEILNGFEVKMNDDLANTDIKAVLETQVRDLYRDSEKKKPLKLRTSLRDKPSLSNHNGKVKKIFRSRSKSRSSDSTPPLSPTFMSAPLLPVFVENAPECLKEEGAVSEKLIESNEDSSQTKVSSLPNAIEEHKNTGIDRSESLFRESKVPSKVAMDDGNNCISNAKLIRNNRRLKDDELLDRVLSKGLRTSSQAKHFSYGNVISIDTKGEDILRKGKKSTTPQRKESTSVIRQEKTSPLQEDSSLENGKRSYANSWWLLAVGNELSAVDETCNYNEVVLVEITGEKKRMNSDRWILIARGLEHDSQIAEHKDWVSVAQGCDSVENGGISIEKYKQWHLESKQYAGNLSSQSQTRRSWDQTYMPISDVEIFETKEYSILDGTFVDLKARRKPVYIEHEKHLSNSYKTFCIYSKDTQAKLQSRRLQELLLTEH